MKRLICLFHENNIPNRNASPYIKKINSNMSKFSLTHNNMVLSNENY